MTPITVHPQTPPEGGGTDLSEREAAALAEADAAAQERLRVVHKYQASGMLPEPQTCEMPQGAVLLHVEPQGLTGVEIWAEVDPEADLVRRRIVVSGTGYQVHPEARYVGTARNESSLVWHVWDLGEDPQDDPPAAA